MITSWQVYWITRLDSANGVAIAAIVVCAICLAISAIVYAVSLDKYASTNTDEFRASTWKYGTRFLVALCLAIVAQVFIPTTREAVAISVIPRIANNEDLQGLGKDVIDTARDWLQELKPNKEKSK